MAVASLIRQGAIAQRCTQSTRLTLVPLRGIQQAKFKRQNLVKRAFQAF
jgi:hypothetical protein